MSMRRAGGWDWRMPSLAVAAALLATGAWGEAAPRTVAKLKRVTGNVLVSREAGLVTGSEAQALANGTRVITTANSEVIVVFDDGCEVQLKENQRLDVDSGKPCAALLPESLAVAQPALGAPLAGYLAPSLIVGGALAGGGSPTGPPPVSPN